MNNSSCFTVEINIKSNNYKLGDEMLHDFAAKKFIN